MLTHHVSLQEVRMCYRLAFSSRFQGYPWRCFGARQMLPAGPDSSLNILVLIFVSGY